MIKQHWKTAAFVVACATSAIVWCFLLYEGNRAKDPVEIVRKHFLFYPEYSHGVWHEAPCAESGDTECREVTYMTVVGNCGAVTFRWRVAGGADADSGWVYEGPAPNLDESRFPLYAILNADSRLIDSPALGKPLPAACPLK